MPDNPAQIINNVNREFAVLLREELKDDTLFPQKYDFHELRNMFSSESDIMIPTQFGIMNEKQYKVLKILEVLDSFWKENVQNYTDAISKLPYLSVVNEKYNTALATYFDTTIIPLDIFPHERLYIQQMAPIFDQRINVNLNYIGVATNLVRIKKVIPLLEINTDVPIIAFAFPFLDPSSLAGTLLPQNTIYRLSEKYFAKIMDNLLINRDFPSDYKEWMSLEFKDNIELDTVLNLDLLRSTLEGSSYSHSIDEEDVSNISLPTDMFRKILEGGGTIADLSTFRIIGFLIHKAIHSTLSMSEYSELYNADMSIKWPGIYKERLEIDALQFRGASGIADELAAAQVLRFPEFKWFADMTIDDVIRLREEKGIQIMREALREERKRIKYSELDDFNGIAESMMTNLCQMVREHEHELELEKTKYKNALGRGSLSLAGTVSLGLISIALPQLALVSIPATIASIAVGGKSIKDMINLVLTGQESLEEIKSRPIGIIAKYLPRTPR